MSEISDYAEAHGLTYSGAYKRLNKDKAQEWARQSNARRAPAKREWEREHDRRPCAQCGQPRGIGAHRSAVTDLCVGCFRVQEEHRLAERDRLLEEMWAAGKLMREIADELGWTMAHLAQEMFLARARGADLPYRRARPRQDDRRLRANRVAA